MTAPVHIFTVDVEDWYQGLDLDMDEWARFAPRLETGRTQEDAFYLPRLLDQLLAERRDVVGIGVVPGELRAAHARRSWALMGSRAFALQVANLAAHRGLGLAGRVVPLARSYSVAMRPGATACPSSVCRPSTRRLSSNGSARKPWTSSSPSRARRSCGGTS
jgi:hypothetical protein